MVYNEGVFCSITFSFTPGKFLWVPEPSCLWPQTERDEQVPQAALQWTTQEQQPAQPHRDNPAHPAAQSSTPTTSSMYLVLRSSSEKSNPMGWGMAFSFPYTRMSLTQALPSLKGKPSLLQASASDILVISALQRCVSTCADNHYWRTVSTRCRGISNNTAALTAPGHILTPWRVSAQ